MIFWLSIFCFNIGCGTSEEAADSAVHDSGYFQIFGSDTLPDGVWLVGTGLLPNEAYAGFSGVLLREEGNTICTKVFSVSDTIAVTDCAVCEFGAFRFVRGDLVSEFGTGCAQLEDIDIGLSETVGVAQNLPYILYNGNWLVQTDGRAMFDSDISLIHYVYPLPSDE